MGSWSGCRGTLRLTVDYVGVGTCTLTAAVAAGIDYSAATGQPQTFTVAQAVTHLVAGAVLNQPGHQVNGPNATLTTTSGQGIAGQTITFNVGGHLLCRSVTNKQGKASCQPADPFFAFIAFVFGYTATYAGHRRLPGRHRYSAVLGQRGRAQPLWVVAALWSKSPTGGSDVRRPIRLRALETDGRVQDPAPTLVTGRT